MPAPLPPTGNLVVSLIIGKAKALAGGRVHIVAPGAVVLGALAVWLVPSQLQSPGLPLPAPVPQVPLQTASVGAVPHVLASVTVGRLPPPGPNQKRSGQCDEEQAQVELNGGCWVATERPPPCPRGKLWEHEGKCWTPVAVLPREPTSGDARYGNVAEP